MRLVLAGAVLALAAAIVPAGAAHPLAIGPASAGTITFDTSRVDVANVDRP